MPKRRLNKNMVVALTLVFFASVIALSAIVLQQMRRRDPANFVKLAERSAEAGEWERAAMFYQRVWTFSKNPEYLVPFGEVQIELGNIGQALEAWRQALVDSPGLLPAHRHLVETLATLAETFGEVESYRRLLEAADAMLDVLAEGQSSDRAFANHARGVALCRLVSQEAQNEAACLESLKQAAALAPASVKYVSAYASRLAQSDRLGESTDLYQGLLDRYPDPSGEASSARVAYAEEMRRRATAPGGPIDEEALKRSESFYREALAFAEQAQDPKAIDDARLGLADLLSGMWARASSEDTEQKQALFAECEQLLMDSKEDFPDAFRPFLGLASLYKRDKRYKDAADLAGQRLARGFPRRGLEAPDFQLKAFRLMVLASECSVAAAAGLDPKVDGDERAKWLGKGQEYADQAAGEFPDHPRVLVQLGRIALAQGNDRTALAHVRRADDKYLERGIVDWETTCLAARLHLRFGEPGAARSRLANAIEMRRDRVPAYARLLFAQALFANDEIDSPQLTRSLESVLAVDPQNVEARRLRAAIAERRGRTTEVMELADSPRLRGLIMARELAASGDLEGSLREQLAILDSDPGDVLTLRFAVGTLLELERNDEARALVERAVTKSGDSIALQQLSLATRTDLTEEQRNKALRDIIESEPDAYRRAIGLIDYHLRNSDFESVLKEIAVAEALLTDRATPVALDAAAMQHRSLLTTKMMAAKRLENEAALKSARDSAIEHNVDGAEGQSFVGLYHLYRDEYDLAAKAYMQMIDAQPTHSRSLAQLGFCLQASGKQDDAIAYYQRALSNDPKESLAHKGLAMIAEANGDVAALDEHLDACQRLIPGDSWVASRMEARAERADPDAAIRRRESQLEENPDDVQNLMRLAYLSGQAGDQERADKHYRSALELLPEDRSLVAQAADHYRRTGRAELARQAIDAYVERFPSGAQRAEARIVLAAHFTVIGDFVNAERALLESADEAATVSVCQATAEFYLQHAKDLNNAIVWLSRAIEQAEDLEPKDLRNLYIARVVAQFQASPSDTENTQVFVDEYRSLFPDDPEVLLWQSEIEARRGKTAESIQALTDFLADAPNDARARIRRARQYVALGRPSLAIQDLEVATVSTTKPNVGALLLMAKLHKQVGRTQEWVEALQRAVDAVPDSQEAVEALVHAFLTTGQVDQAERVVNARINRTQGPSKAAWLGLRARIRLAEGDTDGQLADAREAARLADYSEDSLTVALSAFQQASRVGEGIEFYKRHAPPDPQSYRLISQYAKLLALSGDQAAGIAAFRLASQRAQSVSTLAVRRVALDVHSVMELPKAIESLEGGVDDEAGQPSSAWLLVALYRLSGDYQNALAKIDAIDKVTGNNESRAALLFEKAELHDLNEQIEPARAAYEEGLKYDERNWVALNNLAYLLADKQGEAELARPYAQRAVLMNDIPQTLDTLGWIDVKLGDFPRAIAALNRAVRLDAEYAIATYHLGEAYRRSGQFSEARDVLTRGRSLAESAGNTELIDVIDASLSKVERRNDAPE